jgi:hypothetical protein
MKILAENSTFTAPAISAIISVIGVLISVCASMFIAGTRWGRIESKVNGIEKDMAEIKGMFKLTLKELHYGEKMQPHQIH